MFTCEEARLEAASRGRGRGGEWRRERSFGSAGGPSISQKAMSQGRSSLTFELEAQLLRMHEDESTLSESRSHHAVGE